jgi:hypothetical protein
MAKVKMLRNKMYKKGIFFTLISLVLVTIITHIFTQSTAGLQQDNAAMLRIQVLDNFITEVEAAYLPLALQAASFKGINATISWMDAQNVWLTNPGTELGSIIKNGTLGIQIVQNNNTVENFTRKVEQTAAKTHGMDLTIKVNSVLFNESAAWQLDIAANVTVIAKSNVGNWSREGVMISTILSIEGLPDPQYISRTDGAYHKTIRRSTIIPGQWNATKLAALITSGNYTRFPGSSAPSYLERFKNSPQASSCCGIESTITDSLLPLAMQNQQKSYADYQFWTMASPCPNGGQPVDLYTINPPVTSPFRLDFDHVAKYNVDDPGESSQITC